MRSLAGDVIKQAFSQQTDEKLHRRLYAAICSCILEGNLKPATRMPPSRDLASELALSRNTVYGYMSSYRPRGIFLHAPAAGRLLLTAYWIISTCAPTGNPPHPRKKTTPAYQRVVLNCWVTPARAPDSGDLLSQAYLTYSIFLTARSKRFRTGWQDGCARSFLPTMLQAA